MNKSSYIYIFFTILLVAIFVGELFYLQSTKSNSDDILKLKNNYVKIVGLPDLAICTEAYYIRYRSLSDLNSIYKDDPNLREYFPSTYAYNHSNLYKNTPSKVVNVK